MVPYGPLDFSKQQLHEPEGESGYRIPDSAPQLRDELQLYCLTATPYLQDKCYMLPTVGNNHALSSRVMCSSVISDSAFSTVYKKFLPNTKLSTVKLQLPLRTTAKPPNVSETDCQNAELVGRVTGCQSTGTVDPSLLRFMSVTERAGQQHTAGLAHFKSRKPWLSDKVYSLSPCSEPFPRDYFPIIQHLAQTNEFEPEFHSRSKDTRKQRSCSDGTEGNGPCTMPGKQHQATAAETCPLPQFYQAIDFATWEKFLFARISNLNNLLSFRSRRPSGSPCGTKPTSCDIQRGLLFSELSEHMWLQHAGGSTWKWQGATSQLCNWEQGRRKALLEALLLLVGLNQLCNEIFLLSTNALKPAGKKSRMEKVRQQSSLHSTAQSQLLAPISAGTRHPVPLQCSDAVRALITGGHFSRGGKGKSNGSNSIFIVYLFAPEYRLLLKRSSAVWESRQDCQHKHGEGTPRPTHKQNECRGASCGNFLLLQQIPTGQLVRVFPDRKAQACCRPDTGHICRGLGHAATCCGRIYMQVVTLTTAPEAPHQVQQTTTSFLLQPRTGWMEAQRGCCSKLALYSASFVQAQELVKTIPPQFTERLS
ncbi:hypothetical protein Anapl_00392 [Anas platyrhynchos]|uniref:Uncharacterized protein n=1 Tax=Anas platyrhynchos TaxID=8839 RepID=R0LKV3_ANAPL|nr:hypothetical protein Anapl_00392 [Anas platyrhynchos]